MPISREQFLGMLAGSHSATLLQSALEAALERLALTNVSVLITDGTTCISASVGSGAARMEAMQPGCYTKLATAMAYMRTSDGSASHKITLAEMFGIDIPWWTRAVTARHLLEHRHCVNESDLGQVSREGDGKISASQILRSLPEDVLAEPGTSYSYSNVGSWLLAAALEDKCGDHFDNVIRDAFHGAFTLNPSTLHMCPATGLGAVADFTVLLPLLVRRTTLFGSSKPDVVLGPGHTASHPAWAPLETGVCFGWKACPYGWYGYQTALVGPHGLMRVHPIEGIGFQIATMSKAPPLVVAQALFSEDLVGTMIVPQPRRTIPVNGEDVCGTYARATSRATISRSDRALDIDALIYTDDDDHQFRLPEYSHHGELIQVGDDIYMVSPKEHLHFYIVAFVRDGSGRVSHMWNGRLLWKKVG